ncbi:hypothetical protein TcasGA2_TC030985 [Tribolium castaneum]|uniref:Uncharacterized protein n=1 Tax=Tribolium castaneum TaxID=7070 RepID=A0A139WN64_TRICA|nr:hypothetical protein TcasGA2_TC030985 [Tribolium castaneum]
MLRDAFNYINIKIVFNNYSLEAWEQVSYDQMSNQVNNMGQMCNNFSDEIAHGIRNLTDDNVNNKCDDESWYMENFNFPNDVQSTMSKTTMKRALNQPSTSRFDEFTNLQPSTSKATESGREPKANMRETLSPNTTNVLSEIASEEANQHSTESLTCIHDTATSIIISPIHTCIKL